MTSTTKTAQDVLVLNDAAAGVGRSLWGDALRHLLNDRLTLLAVVMLTLLTLAAFAGPIVVESVLHVDVEDASVRDRYQPPSEEHPLGTDQLGRDQLIRLLYGGRVSLIIAFTASLLSMTIGVIVGLISGFYSGVVDDVIMWFITTLSSIPSMFLLLIVSATFSPSVEVLVLVLGLLGWLQMARLVRGQVKQLRHQDFVLAAQSVGSTNLRIMATHIFPNVFSIIIVALTINAGTLILVESGLSFLGLGVQPPTPTWGNMLSDARSYFARGVHLVIWPGLLIMITVMCFFLVGDGLRDSIDPRNRGK